VVVGSRNWIIPAFELEEFFFPQPDWILDAIHERILPLNNHITKNDFTFEKTLKLNKGGV
jgi:2-oxoisovalerate dehydrogenase E1 component